MKVFVMDHVCVRLCKFAHCMDFFFACVCVHVDPYACVCTVTADRSSAIVQVFVSLIVARCTV